MHPCGNSGHWGREVPGGTSRGRRRAGPPGVPPEPRQRDCRMTARRSSQKARLPLVYPCLSGAASRVPPEGATRSLCSRERAGACHRKRRVTSRGLRVALEAGLTGGLWLNLRGPGTVEEAPKGGRDAQPPAGQSAPGSVESAPALPSSRPAPAQPAPATRHGTPSPPPSCTPSPPPSRTPSPPPSCLPIEEVHRLFLLLGP